MVPVTINCACGWQFSFETEPVNERMASPAVCPGCGADVTAAANASISRYLAANRKPEDQVVIHPVKHGLHLETPVYAPKTAASEPEPEEESGTETKGTGLAYSARQLGRVSREQAEIEARAKVSWGDSEEEVIKYLIIQGFSVGEARELTTDMFKKRRSATRVNGIRKIVIGSCLMSITLLVWGIFTHMDELSARVMVRIMGAAVLVGCVGLWFFVNGLVLLLAPKMDHQDLAEQ